MTQKERRDSEMLYRVDEEIGSEILRARRLTQQLNTVDRTDFAAIAALVEELFGKVGEGAMVTPPFYCDVGTNIEVGRNFFANYNCTVLDVAKLTV
ncbi:MAG: sugar O-acetyltransferase, partial [Clostridia bacterium]|nr:sugar O-acetyltransferase [Clostridia bacterium]